MMTALDIILTERKTLESSQCIQASMPARILSNRKVNLESEFNEASISEDNSVSFSLFVEGDD